MPTQILLLSSRDAAQHLNTPTKGTAWGAQNPCPVLPFGGSPCVRQPTKNLFSHPGYENSQGASQGWLWAEKEHIVTGTHSYTKQPLLSREPVLVLAVMSAVSCA